MTGAHSNSIIDTGLNPVMVESGRIVNVNMRRWTADVRTDVSQSLFLDIQWSNPYLHFTNGEGVYVMPEVGAKCMVCRPSDCPPFIMSFVTTFERNLAADGEETQGEVELQEGQEPANSNITFASGRPDMQQGDIMLRTRDNNQVWLRRGGVVEIGSSHVNKRLYIPLLNYIRDFCENYSLMTFGGDISWTVKRTDSDPDGEAKALLKVVAKEAAQDEKATVAIQVGEVTDDDRLSITVAPDAIDLETMEVDGGALYEFKVDKEGSVEVTTKKDATITIEGDLEQTVQGSSTYEYQGDVSVDVTGKHEQSISGSRKVTARSGEERYSSSLTVTSPSILLGSSGASEPLVMFTPLIRYLTTHVHPPTGGPPTTPPPVLMGTRKVRGE